jgi:hypothetical protein
VQLEVMTVRFRMTKVRKFPGVGLLLLFGELGPKNYDFPRYHVNDALKANLPDYPPRLQEPFMYLTKLQRFLGRVSTI